MCKISMPAQAFSLCGNAEAVQISYNKARACQVLPCAADCPKLPVQLSLES
jgi:hypothetical protein